MTLRFVAILALLIPIIACTEKVDPQRQGAIKPEQIKSWFRDYVKEKSSGRLDVSDLKLTPGVKTGVYSCTITLRAQHDCYVFKRKMLDKGWPVFDAVLEDVAAKEASIDRDRLDAGDAFDATFTIVPISQANGSVSVFFGGTAEGN